MAGALTRKQQANRRGFGGCVVPCAALTGRVALLQDNCKSQSEFIEKAIIFYSGYVSSKDNTKFLPIVITSKRPGKRSEKT
ncbi:hypothetical protein JCM17380_42510 [Desulfosporosinus burensis]